MLVASFTVLVLGILQRDTFFGVQDAIENSIVGSARPGKVGGITVGHTARCWAFENDCV